MGKAILLYDGFCVLCSWSVQWLIKRDQQGVFRFVPIQSEEGQQLLLAAGPEARKYFEKAADQGTGGIMSGSVILLLDQKPYFRSDAILLSVEQLGGKYTRARWLRKIPKFIRDTVYNMVGRCRYNWFGKRDQCYMPSQPGTRN